MYIAKAVLLWSFFYHGIFSGDPVKGWAALLNLVKIAPHPLFSKNGLVATKHASSLAGEERVLNTLLYRFIVTRCCMVWGPFG